MKKYLIYFHKEVMRHKRMLHEHKQHFTAEERKGHRLHKVHLIISAAYVTLSPCTPGGQDGHWGRETLQFNHTSDDQQRPLICCVCAGIFCASCVALLLLFKLISVKSEQFWWTVHILAGHILAGCVSMIYPHPRCIWVLKICTEFSFY